MSAIRPVGSVRGADTTGCAYPPRYPESSVNAGAWHKALAAAGLKGMRWHDIRHLWASWLIQKTGSTRTVQEMGGWSDERMVRRYAHLYVDHLRPGAEAVSDLVREIVLGKAE